MNTYTDMSSKALLDQLGPLSTDEGDEHTAADSSASSRAQATELHGIVQRRTGDSAGPRAGARGLNDVVGSIEGDSAAKVPFQSEMEQAFGQRFDQVQAYSGSSARDACDALGAEAFTVGNRVAFRSSSPDKQTVAHELVHVVQQSHSPTLQTKLTIGRADGAHERQASELAAKAVQGEPIDASQISVVDAGTVSRAPRQTFPELEKMWEAHPHNYQANEEENTSSAEVNESIGWDPYRFENTCAIRMSVMLNQLGGNYKISRPKAKAAGIDPKRVVYSKTTQSYYILSALEMWNYVTYWFGPPSKQFPASGRYKNEEAFNKAWTDEIKTEVSSKQGFVAFEKIFGYSGTGHVDIFKGESLSDAPNWYPSKRLKLWYV